MGICEYKCLWTSLHINIFFLIIITNEKIKFLYNRIIFFIAALRNLIRFYSFANLLHSEHRVCKKRDFTNENLSFSIYKKCKLIITKIKCIFVLRKKFVFSLIDLPNY